MSVGVEAGIGDGFATGVGVGFGDGVGKNATGVAGRDFALSTIRRDFGFRTAAVEVVDSSSGPLSARMTITINKIRTQTATNPMTMKMERFSEEFLT
ncbi:MAG: hypothetical protein N2C12_09760 [Planctomycetales bacterium]